MPNYPSIDPDTISEIVTMAGSNAQEQAWIAQGVTRSIRQSPFSKIIGGALSGRPILQVVAAQKIAGDTVNLKIEAPDGGPLVQGGSATRTGQGEADKFKMFSFTVGVGWKGKKWNNVAKHQTMLGTDVDSKSRLKLSEWHSRYQADCMEASMLANKHALNTLYCGRKTSVDALTSADTFVADDVRRAKDMLQALGSFPFNMAKKGQQKIDLYYAQLNNKLLDDMERSSEWQALLQNSDLRGAENSLYTGFLPTWSGNALNRWEVTNDDAYGPQGAFCAPVAYLGETVLQLPATGYEMKGGRTAAGAALTTPLYFQYFPAAAFTGYHGSIIAADTGTEYYALIKHISGASAGKFTMVAYQVNSGNRLTLTKVLRSTNATSGKIDATTVGSAVWGSGVYTSTYFADADAPVGSPVYPCNAKGQPFVYGYVLGGEALACGYGRGSSGLAMGGRTTSENQNHGLETEIGMELCWGVKPTTNADGTVCNYAVIAGAWNPDGLPTIV